MPDPLNAVLDQLDGWRHLPKYRLEQHVDVLFGMTLPRVLSHSFGIPEHELEVIPEFPIRYGTLRPCEVGTSGKPGANQSFNVDFSVWHRECGQVFLVELKTDMDSLKSEQLCDMAEVAAHHHGFGAFIDGITEIAEASPEARKYAQLIWRLHKTGVMCVPRCFVRMRMEDKPLRLTGVFRSCRSAETYRAATPNLVLVSPERPTEDRVKVPDVFKCIDFHQYAHIIHGTGELEDTFAYYLLRWQSPAGITNPWLRPRS